MSLIVDVFDAALNEIATSTRLSLCSAEPANFAAIAGVSLGSVTLTAGNGNGDFTIVNGDVSGRKLTVAPQSVTVGTTGTMTHVVLDDGTDLQYVTTVTSQALTAGAVASVGAWDIELQGTLFGSVIPDFDALPNAVASDQVGHSAGDLNTQMPNAGNTWNDPHLGTTVVRLTDASFPFANSNGFCLDYGNNEGGASQVWESGGTEYVTVTVKQVTDAGGAGAAGRYLFDVNLSTGAVSNYRSITGADGDLSFAWSRDPSTPRICYYTSGGALQRYDSATDTLAHMGRYDHFPVSGAPGNVTSGAWLEIGGVDDVFKWQQIGDNNYSRVVHDVDTETNIVASTPGSPVAYGTTAENESYLNDAGDVEIMFDSSSSYDHCTIGGANGGSPSTGMVHPAIQEGPLGDWISWVDVNDQHLYASRWNGSAWTTPARVSTSPDLYNPATTHPGNHENASYKVGNTAGWMMTTPDSNASGNPNGGAAHNHLVAYLPDGSKVKTVAFVDNLSGSNQHGYYRNSFGNLGLDGRTAVYTSFMNGNSTARSDVFLTIIPTTVG